MKTAKFRTTYGLWQGVNLRLLLFIIYMNEIITEVSNKTKKMMVGSDKMKPVKMSEYLFADDIAILADTEIRLKTNVDIWVKELDKEGIKIKISKTKVVVICNKKEREISTRINNQTVD